MDRDVRKTQLSIRITKPQRKALQRLSRRDGVPVSEIIRRGIEAEIERRSGKA